jgi:hypothetical protein
MLWYGAPPCFNYTLNACPTKLLNRRRLIVPKGTEVEMVQSPLTSCAALIPLALALVVATTNGCAYRATRAWLFDGSTLVCTLTGTADGFHSANCAFRSDLACEGEGCGWWEGDEDH